MLTGLDVLLTDAKLRRQLHGQRLALLAHPASITTDLEHGLDALFKFNELNITAALGPQHGLRGDKQDNMVESQDYQDPIHDIPVFSLYGAVRRPTIDMLNHFDTLIIDLQDLGCRIYTFITTLRYCLEAAAASGKIVWVLDRPNPVGRPIEGLTLQPGWESFVGAGPLPMRHGLTMGELTHWFVNTLRLNLDYRVIPMQGWQPHEPTGYGWHVNERTWINPSPNASNLNMARCYAGTVMLEGTTLSEGRGTTHPLEICGAPDLNPRNILQTMHSLAPHWIQGCKLRECWFEPTFHKHQGQLCGGIHIHAENNFYDHLTFRPWRLIALVFKAVRKLYPDYPLWRNFPYEYEYERLAIDLINGSAILREWVDNPHAKPEDLDKLATHDELIWQEECDSVLLY